MATTARETIIITGASRGIGEATARRLAGPETELLLVARSGDQLQRVCRELARQGAFADYLVADLSTVEQARDAAEKIARRCDNIDILVLNAGMSNDKRFEDQTLDEVVYELGVNYLAPVTLLHSLLPQLKRRSGHVIVVGSLAVFLPLPANATYAASKAPFVSLIKSLRLEMKETGLHFGIVLPGLTDTAATKDMNSAIPRASTEDIADAIHHCITTRKGLIIPGAGNRLAAAIFQQFPGLAEKVIEPIKNYLIPGFDNRRDQ